MFDLYFNNMIKRFLAIATSAMVYSACNKNNYSMPLHIAYVMCFFIISSLLSVIINLVVINEIICITIIVVLMLSVNNKLNKIDTLNKIIG